MAADPIHQFQIIDLFPVAKIGHSEIAFTNSAAFMIVAVLGISAFLIGVTGVILLLNAALRQMRLARQGGNLGAADGR